MHYNVPQVTRQGHNTEESIKFIKLQTKARFTDHDTGHVIWWTGTGGNRKWGVMAQLSEHRTEKPLSTILTRVRFPGAARYFFLSQSQLPVQTLLIVRCPYSPRAQSHSSTPVSVLVKNPEHWQPCHCLDTRNYCTH